MPGMTASGGRKRALGEAVDRLRARPSRPCRRRPESLSYQRRPVGSASRSGLPPSSFGKKPMLSEWSATTRKSSGRDSLARLAVDDVTSSPLRESIGVLGPEAAPKAPASKENPVWRCVSPKAAGSERSGRHRANRAFVGKQLSGSALSKGRGVLVLRDGGRSVRTRLRPSTEPISGVPWESHDL